jgi:nicotinamide mononucleotide adenylyltransferase
MKHVYVVLVGYDYAGDEVDSAWSSQERALKRQEILKNKSFGDDRKIAILPVDNMELLNDDSTFCWDTQYVGR